MIDIKGKKFGRLVAISETECVTGSGRKWFCRCDCGNGCLVSKNKLLGGRTKSCGCLRKEKISALKTKHGMYKSRIYQSWRSMLQRCNNEKNRYYENYGGRGIRVCDRWLDFVNFYKDMGEMPEEKTLDRIDNDGDYTPENCRWSSAKRQARNRTSSKFFTYKGKTKTLAEWAEIRKINYKTLHSRIHRNKWSLSKALGVGVHND